MESGGRSLGRPCSWRAAASGPAHSPGRGPPRRAYPQASGRNAALAAGLTHDPDGLHQFRRERQRHRDGHTRLVEHGGKRTQKAVGTGERVGRAEAQQDHRKLQPEDECVEDGLQRDRAADAHRGGPRGQRRLRQREEHVSWDAALTEEDLDHDPDDDDEHADAQKEGDRTRPWRTAPAGRYHDTGHDPDEGQQKRIVRPHGADRQASRPQPPRHRVQGAAPGGGGPGHSSAGRRRHRKKRETTEARDDHSDQDHREDRARGPATGIVGRGAGHDRPVVPVGPWVPPPGARCPVPRAGRGRGRAGARGRGRHRGLRPCSRRGAGRGGLRRPRGSCPRLSEWRTDPGRSSSRWSASSRSGRGLRRGDLGRRIADLCVGRSGPGRRIIGVVRFVGLELPTFDIVGRARDRLLCRAVVGIHP